MGQFQDVGQVGNLRADCQSAQTARVNNPLQDNILPHILKLTHYPKFRESGSSNRNHYAALLVQVQLRDC